MKYLVLFFAVITTPTVCSSQSRFLKPIDSKQILTDVIQFNKTTPPNKTVLIGEQTWMVKNLDVTLFRNGDVITHATSEYAWQQGGLNQTPMWCYVWEGHPEFGKFYNGYALIDKRGLAPEGWHISSGDEFKQLYSFLGGNNMALNKMTSKIGWSYPSNQSTNSSGFSALALGSCSNRGTRNGTSDAVYFWTISDDGVGVFSFFGGPEKAFFSVPDNSEDADKSYLLSGMSIRCIKDK